MKNSNIILLKLLTNIQIVSALIWAFAIIACSWITGESDIANILIVAAGFHVVLLSRLEKDKSTGETECLT